MNFNEARTLTLIMFSAHQLIRSLELRHLPIFSPKSQRAWLWLYSVMACLWPMSLVVPEILNIGVVFPLIWIALWVRGQGPIAGAADTIDLWIWVALMWSGLMPESVSTACQGIALMSLYSYFAAGLAKLRSKFWHTPNALLELLDSSILKPPNLPASLRSLLRIGQGFPPQILGFWQLTAPFVLFSQSYALIFLSLAFVFHIINARYLGLTGFLRSWLCTYPAILSW